MFIKVVIVLLLLIVIASLLSGRPTTGGITQAPTSAEKPRVRVLMLRAAIALLLAGAALLGLHLFG